MGSPTLWGCWVAEPEADRLPEVEFTQPVALPSYAWCCPPPSNPRKC